VTDDAREAPDEALLVFNRGQRKRATFVGALSLLLLFVAVAVLVKILKRVDGARAEVEIARSELQSVQHDLETAKLNRDSLASDIQAKTQQLEKLKLELVGTNERLGEVNAIVAEAPEGALATRIQKAVSGPVTHKPAAPKVGQTAPLEPLERVSTVRLSLTPTKDSFKDRPVYQVRVWTDMPKGRTGEVLKTEYFFDHPSFVPNLRTSLDGDKNFQLSFRGYGCVPTTATLIGVDGKKHALPFDMCALWVQAQAAAAAKKQ
jgi:uncharacterized protein YoxC